MGKASVSGACSICAHISEHAHVCWLSVQRDGIIGCWASAPFGSSLAAGSVCVRAGALQTCGCDRNARHVTPVCNRDHSLWCLPTVPCFIVASHTRKYISSRRDMWACQIALECVGLIRSLLDVAAVVLHSKEAENGLILKRKTLQKNRRKMSHLSFTCRDVQNVHLPFGEILFWSRQNEDVKYFIFYLFTKLQKAQ